MRCFATFGFQMCFARRRRANFCQPFRQMGPHPPLYRGYLSDHRGAQNIVKHSISRIFYPSSLWLMVAAQLSILSEVWLLNFLWRSAFPTTVTHLSNSSIHFRRQLHTWATPIFIFNDSYTLEQLQLSLQLRRQSHTWASPGYIFDDSYTLEQLQFFHQNRALARSFHKFLHLFQSLDITVTIRIAIFMMLLHKVLRLPRKMHVEAYETLRLSRKIADQKTATVSQNVRFEIDDASCKIRILSSPATKNVRFAATSFLCDRCNVLATSKKRRRRWRHLRNTFACACHVKWQQHQKWASRAGGVPCFK